MSVLPETVTESPVFADDISKVTPSNVILAPASVIVFEPRGPSIVTLALLPESELILHHQYYLI